MDRGDLVLERLSHLPSSPAPIVERGDDQAGDVRTEEHGRADDVGDGEAGREGGNEEEKGEMLAVRDGLEAAWRKKAMEEGR